MKPKNYMVSDYVTCKKKLCPNNVEIPAILNAGISKKKYKKNPKKLSPA